MSPALVAMNSTENSANNAGKHLNGDSDVKISFIPKTEVDAKYAGNKTAIPARYVLLILGFLGFFNVYAMRVNLSVAMVAMVKEPIKTDLPGSENVVACQELLENHYTYNSSVSQNVSHAEDKGEFDWDSNMQGLVLGSFFYGYVITQIPAGVFAEKYGAKWLYGIGMLITSIFTLLTPVAARWNVWALVVVRVIEGIGEGVTYPAMNALIGRWSPKLERSRLSTIIYSGSTFGTVATLSISGVMSDSTFLGGWPSVFYVFGAIGCVWFVFWVWLVYESPDTHPRISKEELLFIKQGQEELPENSAPIPWKSILTSVPMWALVLTHCGESWGFYTLLIELPLYLSHILHFDLQQNGVLSALPNLMHALFAIAASFMADKLRASGRVGVTNVRKIFNSIGLFGPAICLLVITFIGCEPVVIVVLLSIAMGINGFVYSGCMVNHVDMSPEFAGTLFGITNCISNFAGFIVPSYVGWIIEDGQTVHSWGIVFITSAVVFVVTAIIYNVFTTAELQPWGVSTTAVRNGNDAKYLEMKAASVNNQRYIVAKGVNDNEVKLFE